MLQTIIQTVTKHFEEFLEHHEFIEAKEILKQKYENSRDSFFKHMRRKTEHIENWVTGNNYDLQSNDLKRDFYEKYKSRKSKIKIQNLQKKIDTLKQIAIEKAEKEENEQRQQIENVATTFHEMLHQTEVCPFF